MGVTHECDWPPAVRGLPKVTRTLIPSDASSREIDTMVRERLAHQRALYTLDLPTLAELRPELIVTQTLCDVCAVAEDEVRDAVRQLPDRPRVLNLEPTCLEDVFDCLRQVGDATGREDRAAAEIATLLRRRRLVFIDSGKSAADAVALRSIAKGAHVRTLFLDCDFAERHRRYRRVFLNTA